MTGKSSVKYTVKYKQQHLNKVCFYSGQEKILYKEWSYKGRMEGKE